MYIRFNDTGETFLITGERRQFWLFEKLNGEQGKAVKGSESYTLFDIEDKEEKTIQEMIEEYDGIDVRDELTESDFEDMEIPDEEL